MADSLLDNYNPLYDIHLRQYFALPHMQKHLQKMGLLESTLNLNGDEVYARHHAMMDMMLKNREAQLLKMAELRKKLDAAEKVEICRRIRTGQSPESYRRGKPSRSLSRNRAAQKNGSGRQRRFSNSYEDRDFVQHIEERNADPDDYDTRDPYKRLSANAKRFNYLHKLDDNTLIAYKDNLKKQLQRLERFREISFGPHSVARQPPPPQASWFFRRRSLPSLTASAPGNTLKEPLRSVLNMRGRKTTTGNKLNASHDSRTSCPPTTRKRKDSNTRLPPINPQKSRVATKPPPPVSLQQITTKLPPAAKKPAPSRGRPSNKRQTTTTTTTTITTSKSPTSTLPILPSVTGYGIFTGAAAAATAAAIGTAAISVNDLISDEPKHTPTPSPPSSPVLETQKTIDRSSPTNGVHHEDLPADILEQLVVESEKVPDQEEQELDDHIARQIVLDNTPIDRSHGDYEDSDSEPEYAEEDRESPEQEFVRQEVQQDASPPSPTEPLAVSVHADETVSPPISDASVPAQLESPQELSLSAVPEPVVSPPSPVSSEKEVARSPSVHSPTLPSPVAAPESPAHSDHEVSPASPVQSVHSSHASEHAEQHQESLPSPVQSVHSSHASEHVEHVEHHVDAPQSPVLSVHSSHASEHFDHQVPTLQSPVASEKDVPSVRSPSVHDVQDEKAEVEKMSAPQSPALSMQSSHISERSAEPVHSDHHDVPQSPVLSLAGSQISEHPAEAAQQSPVLSVHSHHAVQHFEQHDAVPQSPVLSVHGSHVSEHHEDAAPQSPILSVHASEHFEESHHEDVPQSPAVSIHSSLHSEQVESYEPAARSPSVQSEHQEEVPVSESPALSVHSSHASERQIPQSPMGSVHVSADVDYQAPASQSPVDEANVSAPRSPSVHSDREPTSQSPAPSVHSYHASEHVEQEPAVTQSPIGSVHASAVDSQVSAPQSPVINETDAFARRSPSVHSDHVPTSQSPVLSVHSSHVSEHDVAAPPSPIASEKDAPAVRSPSIHEEEPIAEVQYIQPAHEVPESPVGETRAEHFAPPIPRSPSVHTSDASENEHEEETFEVQHLVPLSHSPAVEEAVAEPAPASIPAPHSPTAMDLYNPSHGNMESPVLSESEHESEHAPAPQSPVVAPASPSIHAEESESAIGVAIADRIDLEAYHNSPTKESTSPVVANPVEIHITPDQVAEQLSSPDQVAQTHGSFEDIINKSADEEASHLIQEALTEAPAIIDMVNTYEERFSPQVSPRQETEVSPQASPVSAVHESEAYELKYDAPDNTNAMMTSIYHPSSDHDGSQTSLAENQPETQTKLNEWDEGDKHVQETTTRSQFTEGNTHHTYSETVTVITDNQQALESPKTSEISPNGAAADNISTDSLIIHDDHEPTDYQMTQSVYQPREEVEEKEWDEGNKHVHEIVSNVEHTDESGKHYTETVTTTTTVIKSGDDLKNNNDDEDGDHSDDQDEKPIEGEERGSNGNLVRETITTTTHTVTSGGLPEGGILVDDGDETNISSI